MKFQSPALRDALAAEYALGNLGARARRRYERALADDPRLAADVARWQRQLDCLAPAEGIAPPPQVWARIEQTIDRLDASRHPRRLAKVSRRALRVWQAWSGLATAAALVLAVLLVRERATLPVVTPALAVAGIAALPTAAEVEAASYAALLELPKETSVRWQISLDPQQRLLSVRSVGYPMLEADEDYELWWVSDDEIVSIGLLPRDGTWQRILPRHVPIGRANQLVITREPAFGSPTDGPTGPVLVNTALRRES
jgi:anti-sigma-K factor RskA